MTTTPTPAVTDPDSADLRAVRELADDILSSGTEESLDAQRVALPYRPALWATLTDAGLTLLTTAEARGGTGAGLRELAVVLESCGYHAAPIPLAEHDLLASWLCDVAGLPNPPGVMTAAVTDQSLHAGHLTATLDQVPWAGVADTVVVAGTDFVAQVPLSQALVDPLTDISGQPDGRVRIDLDLDQFASIAVPVAAEFRLRGALARSLQTCGALARALESSSEHARQREQFGRPIAKFQAVQTLIADAAGALALAKTAADFAVHTADTRGFSSTHATFAVAVAKIEAARAATLVARNAHQVHGAIGFTLDHRLRHFTSRALAWRSEFGVQREWQQHLGELALAAPDGVWALVTALSGADPDSRR